MSHECKFTRTVDLHTEWSDAGVWKYRGHYKVKACANEDCNQIQGTRQGTHPVQHAEWQFQGTLVVAGKEARELAQVLIKWTKTRKSPDVPLAFIVKEHGHGDDLHAALLNLAEGNFVTLITDPHKDLQPGIIRSVRIHDQHSLVDFGHPGRRRAIDDAIKQVQDKDLHDWLVGNKLRLKAAAQVEALHAFLHGKHDDHGLGIRALSAAYAGDSKLFQEHQALILEAFPNYEYLFRETTLEWLGGAGKLTGTEIDLAEIGIVGVPQLTILGVQKIEWPRDGLFLVENKACFEAVAKGLLPQVQASLVAWTGGQPGSGIRHITALAKASGAPVRIWFDMDGEGLMMAEEHIKTAKAKPFAMSLGDFHGAPVRKQLKASKQAAARRAVLYAPSFADVADSIIRSNHWVEQEVLLPALTR